MSLVLAAVPTRVAYDHSDRQLDREPVQDGCCAICAHYGPGVPVYGKHGAVSDNFTDYDLGRGQATDNHICMACCWVFRTKPLRLRPVAYTRTGHHVLDQPSKLYAALATPIGYDRAVSISVGRQKHAAPWADWGTLRTERLNDVWDQTDVDRLAVLADLRALGFNERALADPDFPYHIARKTDRNPLDLHDQWMALEDWRTNRRHCLDIALLATRKDK